MVRALTLGQRWFNSRECYVQGHFSIAEFHLKHVQYLLNTLSQHRHNIGPFIGIASIKFHMRRENYTHSRKMHSSNFEHLFSIL